MPAAAPLRSDFKVNSPSGEFAFTVDLDGFEGPLDLLRRACPAAEGRPLPHLGPRARRAIPPVRRSRPRRHLEAAADYLVMAAWLAFLKSRLLLPAPPQAAKPDASELAEALARRLRKLEAIRKAAGLLFDRIGARPCREL